MKNYGFEVSLNGKKLCRAGFDTKYSIMTAILTSCRRKTDNSEEFFLDVGGMSNEDGNSYQWAEQSLKENDQILIKIIDCDFDKGTLKENQLTEGDIIKDKIAYYHHLKEELKEYLNE